MKTLTHNPLHPEDGNQSETPLQRFLGKPIQLNWELLLYALILCLALFSRFHILGARVMSHDESLHTYYSFLFYERGDFTHTPLMHGPLLFEANALIYALFGDNDFTARLYPALLGVLLVLSPALFRRWLGRYAALLASLFLLISPLMLYYNRYIRHDTPILLFVMLLIWSALMYMDGPANQRGRARWLYSLGIWLLLCFASKENTFIYIGIIGSFFTLYWLCRLAQRYRWQGSGRRFAFSFRRREQEISLRRPFELLLIGILLGGLLAIIMTGIFSVALHGKLSFSARVDAIASGFGQIFSPAPEPLLDDGSLDQFRQDQQQREQKDFLIFIFWSLILALATLVIFFGAVLRSFHYRSLPWREILAILLIAALICGILLVLESRSLAAHPEALPDTSVEGYRYPLNILPFYLAWALVILVAVGMWQLKKRGFWDAMREFPEFDVLIVLGTLTLPWVSAVLITAMGPGFTYGEHINGAILTDIARASLESIRAILPINFPGYDEASQAFSGNTHYWQVALSLLPILPFFIISAAVGLAWHRRRWLILAALYFSLYTVIFTSIFTNSAGMGSGFVSSLGYWLGQQGVRRGSQPQYYYTGFILPLYEYLHIIGALLAMIAGLARFWRRRSEMNGAGDAVIKRLPLSLFFAWWAILALFGYTMAGEKMPWLGMHMVLPMMLMSALFMGRVLSEIRWREFMSAGWITLLLAPGICWGGWRIVGPILRGEGPLGGLTSQNLRHTTLWIGALVFTLALCWLILRARRRQNFRQLGHASLLAGFIILSLITARTAFAASFIHYDLREPLVYAHSAPQVKYVLELLDELSERSENDRSMRIAYGGQGVSWPMEWYMREYPNSLYLGVEPDIASIQSEKVLLLGTNLHNSYSDQLASEYLQQRYLRLWWPNQDYFNLTPARINQLFDFSPSNQYAANLRAGLLDIFWSRDYTKYFETVGRVVNVGNWDPSDSMYLYVHRDLVSRVWTHEVGVLNRVETIAPVSAPACPFDDGYYRGEWLLSDPELSLPVGLATRAERIVIADEELHQILTYTLAGERISRIGQFGDIGIAEDSEGEAPNAENALVLNRPNAAAIAADGSVYIADTWNNRILRLDDAGNIIAQWGERFWFGANAPAEPFDGLWAPRDLVIDGAGNLYIADTGNKRIRVYDASGAHLYDIGRGGSGAGELEEPGSLAIDPLRNELYISEWWNQRISVFSLAGEFLRSMNFPLPRDENGIAAQIAMDSERGLLYLAIPSLNRVLVMHRLGGCLLSFGPDFGNLDFRFTGLMDIATDEQGNLLAIDRNSKQIYRFPPYGTFPLIAPQSE